MTSPRPSLPPSPPNYVLSQQLPTNSRSVSSLKFSNKGHLLAAASADGLIRLFNVVASPSAPLSPFPSSLPVQHDAGGINEVSFSPDDRLLCSASDDKTLCLFDLETQQVMRTLRGHSHYVFCCSFSPTSSLLLSGSWDETIRLWDLRQQKPARSINAHSEPVVGLDCAPSSNQAVSASYDGLCRVWDLLTGQCLKTVFLPEQRLPPCSAVRFTPNGKFLLSSYLDSSLRLWDFHAGGQCVKQYDGHVNKTHSCASAFLLTHERKYLTAGSEDGRLYLWDVQTKEIVQRVDVGDGAGGGGGGGGVCLAVSCHPTRHLIVSSATVDAGQQPQLSVFIDTDTKTVQSEEEHKKEE